MDPTALEQEDASSTQTSGSRLIELARRGPVLAKLVAQNHAAPPEILEELASPDEPIMEKLRMMNPPHITDPWMSPGYYTWHHDPETRSLVARNPNTAVSLLLRLAAHFPESFAENPALPLLLLEHADLFLRMSDYAALRIMKLGRPAFLTLLLHHSDQFVRRTIAENTDVTAEQLNVLARDGALPVVQAVAKNPNISPETALFLAGHSSGVVRFGLSRNISLTRAAAGSLSDDSNESIRSHVRAYLDSLGAVEP